MNEIINRIEKLKQFVTSADMSGNEKISIETELIEMLIAQVRGEAYTKGYSEGFDKGYDAGYKQRKNDNIENKE